MWFGVTILADSSSPARGCPCRSPDVRVGPPGRRSLHVRFASPSMASLAPIARLYGTGSPEPPIVDSMTARLRATRIPRAGVADQRRHGCRSAVSIERAEPRMGAANVRRRGTGSPKPGWVNTIAGPAVDRARKDRAPGQANLGFAHAGLQRSEAGCRGFALPHRRMRCVSAQRTLGVRHGRPQRSEAGCRGFACMPHRRMRCLSAQRTLGVRRGRPQAGRPGWPGQP